MATSNAYATFVLLSATLINIVTFRTNYYFENNIINLFDIKFVILMSFGITSLMDE